MTIENASTNTGHRHNTPIIQQQPSDSNVEGATALQRSTDLSSKLEKISNKLDECQQLPHYENNQYQIMQYLNNMCDIINDFHNILESNTLFTLDNPTPHYISTIYNKIINPIKRLFNLYDTNEDFQSHLNTNYHELNDKIFTLKNLVEKIVQLKVLLEYLKISHNFITAVSNAAAKIKYWQELKEHKLDNLNYLNYINKISKPVVPNSRAQLIKDVAPKSRAELINQYMEISNFNLAKSSTIDHVGIAFLSIICQYDAWIKFINENIQNHQHAEIFMDSIIQHMSQLHLLLKPLNLHNHTPQSLGAYVNMDLNLSKYILFICLQCVYGHEIYEYHPDKRNGENQISTSLQNLRYFLLQCNNTTDLSPNNAMKLLTEAPQLKSLTSITNEITLTRIVYILQQIRETKTIGELSTQPIIVELDKFLNSLDRDLDLSTLTIHDVCVLSKLTASLLNKFVKPSSTKPNINDIFEKIEAIYSKSTKTLENRASSFMKTDTNHYDPKMDTKDKVINNIKLRLNYLLYSQHHSISDLKNVNYINEFFKVILSIEFNQIISNDNQNVFSGFLPPISTSFTHRWSYTAGIFSGVITVNPRKIYLFILHILYSCFEGRTSNYSGPLLLAGESIKLRDITKEFARIIISFSHNRQLVFSLDYNRPTTSAHTSCEKLTLGSNTL